jgi:hypothetical protein
MRMPVARGVRALRRLVAESDGVVLMWALIVMFVLMISTGAVIQLVTSNEQAFGGDARSTSALAIAEAGLASAAGAIEAAPDTTTSLSNNGTLQRGTWSYTAARTQDSLSDPTKFTWTITSTGVLAGMTHVVRDTLSQTVVPTSTTSTTTTTTPASAAYGYGVFLGAKASDCTTSGTNVNTFSNSAALSTSVYVAGSLCLSGGSDPLLAEPATSPGGTVSLYVGGKFQTDGNSSPVGTSTKMIKSATIVGGCINIWKKNPKSVTCSAQGDPTNSSTASGVWATTYSSTQNTIAKPTIDPNWYSNAKPGPQFGCNNSPTNPGNMSSYPSQNTSGTPQWSQSKFMQTVIDGDSTRNTSVGTVDIFQLVNNSGSGQKQNSFDCRYYDSSGNLIGELAWAYPAGGMTSSNPGTLTILGTVFIDGNLSFASSDYAVYQGTGTIYVNGTVTISAGAKICAKPVTGSACVGNFDPTQNLLELVAINAGNATNGWSMTGAGTYEGIAFTNGAFNGANGSQTDGPVVADTGTLSGAETLQDTVNPPAGAPGAATTSTTTTTTSGADQVSFAANPGSWQQLG